MAAFARQIIEEVNKEWLMKLKFAPLRLADTRFFLQIQEEDHAPDWERPDDNEDDALAHDEMMRNIDRRLRQGDLWAYCHVAVSAVWDNPNTGRRYVGRDTLGGCSYEDMRDFMENSGYFDDMVREAWDALQKNVKADERESSIDQHFLANSVEVPSSFVDKLLK